VENGSAIIRALDTLALRLTADNRVQLRWETFCFEAIEIIREALAGPRLPSIAFNDHTSMVMLHPSIPLQERPFDFVSDFPAVDPETPAFAEKMAERAKRADLVLVEWPEGAAPAVRRTWVAGRDAYRAVPAGC
jgi:alpha-D-ribose 1-methylphosphonate 5-triphosphate diphosphatase